MENHMKQDFDVQKIIEAIQDYCKLPDPPLPGNEESQGVLLDNTVDFVTSYFKSIPDDARDSEAIDLIDIFIPDDEIINQEIIVKFDVARSIIETALNRSRR